LYQKQRHSIEHIIPRDFLDRYLANKGVPRHVRYGATTNPFNFAPSERGLNAKRSNFPFGFNNDQIVRPNHWELHPENFSAAGFNADHEWVIPSRNRGDIARAILYMLLMYEIDELYNQHISTLIHWAKIDSPSTWEIAYNHWVYTRLGIRNPFIDSPENALLLLDNKQLMQSLEVR
jgi:endonuclease I